MLFLIEYDRNAGRIVTLTRFDDSQCLAAEDARLYREIELHRLGVEREIVILDAETEEALRRTHRRYFEDLEDLVKTPA